MESILGLILLTLVSLAAGIVIIKTSQQIVHQQLAKKAAKLGEMVQEFYQDQSIGDFYNLGQWNRPTPVPVQTFLGLAYNPGNFRITTNAQCDSQFSNCMVTSTITWNDGQKNNSVIFRKNFAERTLAVPSGTAMVYAGPPCGTLTDPQAIVAACPNMGFPGILISAPTQANPNVKAQALTGSDGIATLGGVQLSSGPGVTIPFTAQAPTTPTDFGTPRSDPNFVQGYYRSGSTIDPIYVVTTDNLPVPVVFGTQARVAFTQFRKMGLIHGTVAGLPCGGGSGCTSAEVEIAGSTQSAVVADPGATSAQNGYRPCVPISDVCRVHVDASGNYEFNNVLPLNTVNLAVPGITGTPTVILQNKNEGTVSHISVPTENGFVRGYSDTTPVPVIWNGSTSDVEQPLQAVAMGDVRIRLTYGANPQYAHPNMSVMYWPARWWSAAQEAGCFVFPRTYGPGGQYGSNTGLLYLSNVVTGNGLCQGLSTAAIYAWIPMSCNHHNSSDPDYDPYCRDSEYERPSWSAPDPTNFPQGVFGRVNCTGTMGNTTDLTINLTPGETLTGQLVAGPGIGSISNLVISYYQVLVHFYNRDESVNTADPSDPVNYGRFALPSWARVKFWDIPQHETDILFRLQRPNNLSMPIRIQAIGTEATTVSTYTYGYSCAQPCSHPMNPRLAGEIPFTINGGDQCHTHDHCATGSNGMSNVITSNGLPWASFNQYPVPTAPSSDLGTIIISSLTVIMGSPNNSHGYECDALGSGSEYKISVNDINSFYLLCNLKGYRVYGHVRDFLGNGLQGVSVFDYNVSRSQSLDISNNPITTDPHGYYSAYFKPSKPGFTAMVSVGTTGQPHSTSYGNINADGSVTLLLPNPLTPDTGLEQNFTLDTKPPPAGGGGM
ncbi:MAG: hypothetical protein WC859_04050 [Elusimicrobiota bacterium]